MADGTQDTAVDRDDLPRFPATKELLYQYGGGWATWGFLVSGVALLVVMFLAFADASTAPFGEVYPAVLAFGTVAFVGGMFVGVLWTGLQSDARERAGLKR